METKHKSYLKCDNNPCICESIIKQVLQEATTEQQKVLQPDIIKEKVAELDTKLQPLFNKSVDLCLQQIRGEITETEREKLMLELDTEAKEHITQALTEAYTLGGKAERERVRDGVALGIQHYSEGGSIEPKDLRIKLVDVLSLLSNK